MQTCVHPAGATKHDIRAYAATYLLDFITSAHVLEWFRDRELGYGAESEVVEYHEVRRLPRPIGFC